MPPRSRICSIDIFRYVCALMVVAVHTHPFSDISPVLGDLFTEMLPRIAVPFFFAVSGYFYLKTQPDRRRMAAYLKKLLFPYILWSAVYFLVEFIRWGYQNIVGFGIDCVLRFFLLGSSTQLWFFPALVMAVLLSTAFFALKWEKALIPVSLLLYLLGCLGISYYHIGVQLPVLGPLYSCAAFQLLERIFMMGFPFFVCGYAVQKAEHKILTSSLKPVVFWGLSAAVWVLEIVLVRAFHLEKGIILTLGLYPLTVFTVLLLLKYPCMRFKSLAGCANVMANFIYYAHPLLMMAFISAHEALSGTMIGPTGLFFLTVGLGSLLGFLIYRWNHPLLNKLVK